MTNKELIIPYYQDDDCTIYNGDCLEVLKTLESESVDCVMTSPPYWALRDYGVKGQLGLEPTFQEYINKLCDIFDEVKRVLKKEGTCWVNMGDTYFGGCNFAEYKGNWNGKKIEGKWKESLEGIKKAKNKVNWDEKWMQPKMLLQIPSRFAIEMCNRGWILRNEIIWHKPNCMPSSVRDRFTVDFEKLFFFVKSKKYYFETQYEPQGKGKDHIGGNRDWDNTEFNKRGKNAVIKYNPLGRNKRAVWRITTKPYKEAHFATYPEELCETPIKAGCPENGIVLDPFFGAGTTGLVAKKLGREFIGIELNQEYIKIAEKRINNIPERLL